MQARLFLPMSPLTAVSLLIVIKLFSAVVTHIVHDSTCVWTDAHATRGQPSATATTTTPAVPIIAINPTTNTTWVVDTATNVSVLPFSSTADIANSSIVSAPTSHSKRRSRSPIGGRFFAGGDRSDVIALADNVCPIELLRLASRIRAEQDRLRDILLQLDIANHRELKHEHVSLVPPTWWMSGREGGSKLNVCVRRTTLRGRLCRRWSIAARFAAQDRLQAEADILGAWLKHVQRRCCSTTGTCGSTNAQHDPFASRTITTRASYNDDSYLGPHRSECLQMLSSYKSDSTVHSRVPSPTAMALVCTLPPPTPRPLHISSPRAYTYTPASPSVEGWTRVSVFEHLVLFVAGFALGMWLIFGASVIWVCCTPIRISLADASVGDVVPVCTAWPRANHLAEGFKIVLCLITEGRVLADVPDIRRRRVLRAAAFRVNEQGNGIPVPWNDVVGRVCAVPQSIDGLDISNNRLVSVPPALPAFRMLTRLSLAHNSIRVLPIDMGQLSRLEVLDLAFNYLSALPSSIVGLSKLRELSLEHNNIRALPDDIEHMECLEGLNLRSNQLSRLDWTSLPPHIVRLSLRQNRLHQLPACLLMSVFDGTLSVDACSLPHLGKSSRVLRATALAVHCTMQQELERALLYARASRSLWLTSSTVDLGLGNNAAEWHNGLPLSHIAPTGVITSLPLALFRMRTLTVLHVPSQALTCLPDAIVALSALRELDVEHNSLTSLPAVIGLLSDLRILLAAGNPIRVLPWSLARLERLERASLPGVRHDDGDPHDPALPETATEALSAARIDALRRGRDDSPWSVARHKAFAYPSSTTAILFATVASANRRTKCEEECRLPHLPPELWLLVFGRLNSKWLQ